ncbi:uncharacterized protein LOC143262639 [Megalopta genalis]|uniref:uncharacterized protein LOC143261185 n=1 Tax=Megalopta genalis TaxID=115081 RepID=UPI003FD0C680
MADKLQLRKREIDSSVGGIANVETRVKYLVNAVIKSRTTQFNDTVTLVTLPSITGMLPSRQVKRTEIDIPTEITLADPEFNIPGPIDAILGNQLFFTLLCLGRIKLCAQNIIIQETLVGWIVTGATTKQEQFAMYMDAISCACHLTIFKRFYSLERKFCKDPDLLIHYKQFLSEYLALGHMTEVSDARDGKEFYLPHHAVIKECSFTTKVRVTYGTASAPFLAVRCLQQLAEDEQIRFPNASRTFKEDFYVDDLLTGASTFNEAINLRNELIDLARNGGFHLRQWASNNHKLISDLKDHDDRQAICLDLSQTKKTLGVFWNPSSDSVTYAVNSFSETRLTKRIVLSQIAQLFDPLGLLGPVIIRAKIIMQDIWKSKVTWDQPIPQDIAKVWLETRNELAQLDNFSCPRRVMLETSREIQLHGYCDASERAYGACIYIRTLDHSGRWIRTAPHLLKTFVANRVSEIQTDSDPRNWMHVSGRDNPADYISRGQLASTFMNNKVWLNDPAWLSLDECFWPQLDIPQREILERKTTITFLAREGTNDLSKNRLTGNLSTTEIRKAHLVIIKQAQLEAFPIEINCLERKTAMPKGSRILNLNPFLDQDKLLRVGGRLRHAPLSYCQKHPLILPHRHHITNLIIESEHLRHWHAGTQATLNAVRQIYWPIDGMRAIKIVIHKCIRCFRVKPKVPAVHLELTSDLTTESCLGAFKRFYARRGKATNIYSDNGTNFVGAKNEITEVQRFLSSNEHNSKINRFLSDQGINWHFSPPRTPHFGGLWEAAVKSFKGHLYKTIGNELFTFEQLNTYIIEVEAILNSCPLTPLSSDPNDITALSPSHFLIGDSLMQLPEYDLRDTPVNKLSSWQHIQRVKQHFWNRWSNEYLQTLHTRNKWHIPNDTQHKKGTLVIIREDNTPPLTWKLGRIIDICPGRDKIVRVATVKTAQGTYQRAIKKLSPLPIDDPE